MRFPLVLVNAAGFRKNGLRIGLSLEGASTYLYANLSQISLHSNMSILVVILQVLCCRVEFTVRSIDGYCGPVLVHLSHVGFGE